MIEERDDVCPLCLEPLESDEPLMYAGSIAAHRRCYVNEMKGSAPLKDHYLVQRKRIESLIKEMEPRADIHWDEDRVPTYIRLRVDDPDTGVILVASSGDLHVSVIADKTDAEVKQLISSWSAGKLR